MTDQEMIAQLKQQIRDDKRKIRNLSRQVKYAKETKAEMKAAAKTAKAEAAKTQKELQRALDAKKKACAIGVVSEESGNAGTAAWQGRRFVAAMIAICCKLYARLGCGLRGIGKVFDTISEELPFLLGEAPSHTTIADWIRVYGLALYSQACKEIAGMRYAIIVDESITIGSQKLLLVLGVPAEHLERPLQHSDVRVLGIEVASSWPACDVELVLRNIIDTVGHEPEYVLSDNGHNLTRATRELNLIHHRDITHTCGCILKEVYGEDPRFLDFTQKLGKIRLQYHLTPLAYLLPPNQRSISRFLNCFKWVEWAEKMSAVLPRLSVKEQETYAFLCDYEDSSESSLSL